MHKLNSILLLMGVMFLMGCQHVDAAQVPTLASAAMVPDPTDGIPLTFTPPPATAVPTATAIVIRDTATPSKTPLPIPTLTPFTPRPSDTPTPTASPLITPTNTPVIKPIDQYSYQEVIPYQAFPVPPGDNGWGMHWIPTVSQSPEAVDRYVNELVKMHIKWAVFLNDGTNIGDNDYLVDKLVANGIMPVMRLYRAGCCLMAVMLARWCVITAPKVSIITRFTTNPTSISKTIKALPIPNQYAIAWAQTAREIVNNGGLPGIGAFSPGGEYSHYDFLDRTLRALKFNGDEALLNHAWLSIHNYHGTRAYDDPGGFLLFRDYDEIVRSQLGRSLPMVGTEGGSYSTNPQAAKNLLVYQYTYMREAEPYLLAFSYWVLANQAAGGNDSAWEWQSLFKEGGWVHPVVTEFFYQNTR